MKNTKRSKTVKFAVHPTIVRNITAEMPYSDQSAMEERNRKGYLQTTRTLWLACFFFWGLCALAGLGWVLGIGKASDAGFACFLGSIMFASATYYTIGNGWKLREHEKNLWANIIAKAKKFEDAFNLPSTAGMAESDIIGMVREHLRNTAQRMIMGNAEELRVTLNAELDIAKDCFGPYRIDNSKGIEPFCRSAIDRTSKWMTDLCPC